MCESNRWLLRSRQCLGVRATSAVAAMGLLVLGGCGGSSDNAALPEVVALQLCDLTSLQKAVQGFEGNMTVTSVETVTAEPVHCRVVGVAKPTPDSIINFEVRLPTANWNGKYMSSFEGGTAGAITVPFMLENMIRGYATAATDTGHAASDLWWPVDHPERVIDFGYRAKHLQTVAAKAIIAAFYGKPPSKSYFNGCSNGGRQAMMELQRYPEDYDGYIIGAPASNLTGQSTYWALMNQALLAPKSQIPDSKLPAIQAASLAQCDAIDGVVDEVISNPKACTFNPDVLVCPAGTDTNECLTFPQLSALKKIYQGPSDSSGRQLYTPVETGTEAVTGPGGLNFAAYATGSEPAGARTRLALPIIGGMLYNTRRWDPASFDFDVDPKLLDAQLASTLNATDPDLRVQKARGAKILHYHGWGDAALSPRESINYYERVTAAMGGLAQTQSFYRLYMVPGMVHCTGGLGPNAFGQQLGPFIGKTSTAQDDIVKALERWVENGEAPGAIIATKFNGDDPAKAVQMRRPLCPYPQVQKYVSGDPNISTSFACIAP